MKEKAAEEKEKGKEKGLNELLKQLEETSREERKKGKIARIIKKIGEEEEPFQYALICVLLERELATGNRRTYARGELLKLLPWWKKSQLHKHLQKAKEEGMLEYEKRKYKLRRDHPLVRRIGEFYTKIPRKEAVMTAIERKQEKRQLEREIRELQKKRGETKKRRGRREGRKKLTKELYEIVTEGLTEEKELVIELTKERLEEIIREEW